MKRLCDATLTDLPQGVARPGYDRAALGEGVVHIGPGAFFRAHQASYLDRLLPHDPRWGVTAISLRSSAARDALSPQDGLYTLARIEKEPRLQVIGAVKRLLVAPRQPEAVSAALASPDIRLVTLTVTEKGYHLDAAGELDLDAPAVSHDLTEPHGPPHIWTGWFVCGLCCRRGAGAPPLAVLSCDNLPDNGGALARAVRRFAEAAGDRDLAAWIADAVRFPRTMVDSITPATDLALREAVDRRLGLHDAWPVQREPFAQWVVEDALPPGGPDLAAAGATLVRDVAPFEQAKLRLLNGAHSTLAYVGRLAGLETVAEAMAEPRLARFVERLMRDAIAPTLTPAPGLDLSAYIDQILERFRNPALRHELAQIAWDGSKKLAPRLLDTAADLLAQDRDLSAIAVPIAAWMRFVRLQAETGTPFVDPLAELLAACLCDGAGEEVARFLAFEPVFSRALGGSRPFADAVGTAHAALAKDPLAGLRL